MNFGLEFTWLDEFIAAFPCFKLFTGSAGVPPAMSAQREAARAS
jgi:hypothetical protein